MAVTLNAPDDWNDHIAMLDYGFSQLAGVKMEDADAKFTVDVVGGAGEQVEVTGCNMKSAVVNAADVEQIKRVVILPSFTYAPVPKGAQLGKISYQLNGKEIGSVPLVATSTVEQQTVEKGIFQKIGDFFKNLF